MTVIQMSGQELTRLRIMIDLADGRTTVEAAAYRYDTQGVKDPTTPQGYGGYALAAWLLPWRVW